jgi:hypothetical protein
MNVIVDTSVWSIALRRNQANNQIATINKLKELIIESKVCRVGNVI